MAPTKSNQLTGHGARIKAKRTELQLTQSAVALFIGVTPPAIGQWERDETMPKGENLIRLADIMQVSPQWIITGSPSPLVPASPDSGNQVYFVPLISIEILKRRFTVRDLKTPPIEYKAVSRSVSTESFAVKIEGDAMLNPYGGPSMPDGTVLIVDPAIVYKDKSFVIAVTRQSGALFRQYMKDGPYQWLRALNPDYSKLKFMKNDLVLGTVVSTMNDLNVQD